MWFPLPVKTSHRWPLPWCVQDWAVSQNSEHLVGYIDKVTANHCGWLSCRSRKQGPDCMHFCAPEPLGCTEWYRSNLPFLAAYLAGTQYVPNQLLIWGTERLTVTGPGPTGKSLVLQPQASWPPQCPACCCSPITILQDSGDMNPVEAFLPKICPGSCTPLSPPFFFTSKYSAFWNFLCLRQK